MIVCDGPLLVVNAYPELTLPQGDDGNALVLAHRARAHGIDVETRTVHCGEALPPADVYVAGGLEDEDAGELAKWLAMSDGLRGGAAAGAAVLGVNTGYQVLGHSFELPDGSEHQGLGLLDVRTRRGDAWIDGPMVTLADDDLGLPAMSGYESHFGITELGETAAPLARLEIGHGNGPAETRTSESRAVRDGVMRRHAPETGAGHITQPRTEGAIAGRVVGTYLHGPVLARNPELADLLLSRVLGRVLGPLPPSFAEEARRRRIDQARDWVHRGRPRVKM